MNKLLFFLILLIFPISIEAQDFEEEFKKHKAQTNEEFNQYKEAVHKDFRDYLQTIDTEFSASLKENWDEYNLHAGITPPEKPKPEEMPQYSKTTEDNSSEIQFKSETKTSENTELIPPVPSKTENVEYNELSVEFYGNNISLNIDKKLNEILMTEISEDAISRLWDILNQTGYGNLISQLIDIKFQLNLNDWGYYLLVKQVMEKIVTGKNNTSVLFAWFFLTKTGYKVKLGFSDNDVHLLIASGTTIYNTVYYNFNGINYYLPDFTGERINTYNADYPEAERIMSLFIDKPINFSIDTLTKDIECNYMGVSHAFHFLYNKNIIDFYKDYPLTDLSVYFNSPVSNISKQSLGDNLLPVIKGMSENEAVDFLLYFVQSSFEYKTDKEHLSYEKFYFPEEILFYPYSDCEDRAVFFSALAKDLLNSEIIGISFPNHVATAILFNNRTEGDYILYDQKKYLICDPTYVNAPAGELIEDCAGQAGEIIVVDNNQNIKIKNEKIWNAISKYGGKRGSNSMDIAYDQDGNFYITGYFNDEMNIGKFKLQAEDESEDIFIAKIDKNATVLWAENIGGEGSDLSYCLSIDDLNNIYIFGQFENSLRSDNFILKSGNGLNGFLACFNPDGELLWMNNIDIDSSISNNSFIAKFNPDKKIEWMNYNQHSLATYNFNILCNANGQIIVSGLIPYLKNSMFSRVDSISYAKYGEFDIINLLLEENTKLIQQKYEKSVASIFAAINLISRENIILTGEIIQKALDKVNPGFKIKNKSLYDNFGNIQSIQKVTEGKIQIHTKNDVNVMLGNIEISNEAQFTVSKLYDGNARFDIFNGIKIINTTTSSSLINYTQLLKQEGSLFFDYGNNYKTRMRMKPDLIN